MRTQLRQFYSIVIPVLLISCLFWSCGDQPAEKSKPSIVSKKISAQDKPKLGQAGDKKPADALSEKPAAKAADEQETSVATRIYDPKNRLNPFLPLFRPDQEKTDLVTTGKTKRKKRIPQTPLERISLEQLQLRAIIRASSGNRALVEDNSGKGYIIKNGTYIGLNSGIVTQISAESVIVEEEIENLMGELVLQNTEIKLQKQTGE